MLALKGVLFSSASYISASYVTYRAVLRVGHGLTAKSDGTKLKPFIVLKGAKRDSKALNEQYRSRCVVASTPNGWMNADLTREFVKTVLGTFSFGKRLLAWDSFECHMESNAIKSLEKAKIDHVIIPGGCTKFIQAPDVSWNKPFKALCSQRCNQWLAEEGVHAETKDGNLKAPGLLYLKILLQSHSNVVRSIFL